MSPFTGCQKDESKHFENVTLSVFTAPKMCEINALNSDAVYRGFITI